MIEQSVSLASNGTAKLPGYEQLVRFGYTKNRGVYRLAVTASVEWEGLAIRCFWHVPGGKDPASSLVVDGYVDVPASVTAQPGSGCVTFEGSDGAKTVTSADLRYRVSANSGTEDGTEPEPGTPAWQQLVDAVHTDATAAEQAKAEAQTAAEQAGASAKKAGQALSDTITAKEDALKAIGDKQTAATQAVDTARDEALQQVETSTQAAQTAASEAVTSAGSASQSAQEAADSLQELKDGIANGDFKGEKGDPGPAVALDTTLTHEGEAADAKATGDAISAVKARQNILVGTETGNPVAVDDAFAAPLRGLTVYGKSTQDGTPTPDAPIPIVSAGDGGSLTVKVTGKNLIQPYEKDTRIAKNGVTMDYNVASQLVHVYGTATEVADIYDARQEIPLSVKSNVTMSITVRAGKILDGVIIQYSDFVTLGLSCTGSKPYDTGAFNRPDSPGYLKFTVNIPKGATVDFTIAAQLELGTTVTAYSPYREQPLTLPTPNGLPGIPVTSGGNYTDQNGQQWVCDEVDLERGVKVQRIKSRRILSSEIADTLLGVNSCYLIEQNIACPASNSLIAHLICTNFECDSWSTVVDKGVQGICVISNRRYIGISVQGFKSVNEYKDFLDENEVGIAYELATPIETPLTPAEIAAYKALTAYGPDTVVQAGDGAGIRLAYQRDVNIAIKRIEDAIASMT
jgi:hypothetical protein